MEKISVVINTYNARQHLRKCLDAVKDFDEIVVCDMESTDDTVAIAREYGCKIVTFPKANHTCCEPARDFAIHSASNKWVLIVDADEIVTPELRETLYRQIQQLDCADGFFIPRKNMFMGEFTRKFDYQLRFLRHEKTYWPPIIHVVPEVNGRVMKLNLSSRKACLLHLMDETMHEYIDKMNIYTDNEIEKKRHKNYNAWSLVWRPAWRFLKKYLLDGAIFEGSRGYVRARLSAVYQFMVITKIIEINKRCK